MRTAGSPGATASVIEHRGRTTGTPYLTPVAAVRTDEGFLIATVYGPRSDWLKNVLASGSAVVVHEGETVPVDRPELIPIASVEDHFPDKHLRSLHRYRVTECLRLRRAEPSRPGDLERAVHAAR